MQPSAGTMISEALRSSVLERIRLLDRRARAVLLCASVIGRRFDFAVLAATAACAPADIRTALQRACALQLLVAEDCAGQRFVFRHALTRDVVYAELLSAPTRPLHRRIARALETVTSGVAIEEIAYHWWAARDRRNGLRSNELVGDHAAAIHAADVALVHYNRAMALADARSKSYARLCDKIRIIHGTSAKESIT
jgi:predicted ATPase